MTQCSICNTTTWGGKQNKPIQQVNEETGQVHGLLCHTCNMGLGCFKRDPGLLYKALDYAQAESMTCPSEGFSWEIGPATAMMLQPLLKEL